LLDKIYLTKLSYLTIAGLDGLCSLFRDSADWRRTAVIIARFALRERSSRCPCDSRGGVVEVLSRAADFNITPGRRRPQRQVGLSPRLLHLACDQLPCFAQMSLERLVADGTQFNPDPSARSDVSSETEPVWVEIAELLRSWFPEVEEAMVEGAGHLLQIQRPDVVARALAAFFERPTH